MSDDDDVIPISTIVADALTRARAAGISELDIIAGFASALLDVAKQGAHAEASRRAFLQAAELLAPEEGNA